MHNDLTEDGSLWATSWCDWADKLRVSKEAAMEDDEEVDTFDTGEIRRPSLRTNAESGRVSL
jgi:hypothetical protein